MRPLLITAALVAALGAAGPARALEPTDPVSILDQTDGVRHDRTTTIALYCRKQACAGKLALKAGTRTIGSAPVAIEPKTTAKVPVKITRKGFAMVKGAPKHKLKVRVDVTVVDHVVSHVITLKV